LTRILLKLARVKLWPLPIPGSWFEWLPTGCPGRNFIMKNIIFIFLITITVLLAGHNMNYYSSLYELKSYKVYDYGMNLVEVG